jgi:hypothetical protein
MNKERPYSRGGPAQTFLERLKGWSRRLHPVVECERRQVLLRAYSPSAFGGLLAFSPSAIVMSIRSVGKRADFNGRRYSIRVLKKTFNVTLSEVEGCNLAHYAGFDKLSLTWIPFFTNLLKE